MAKSVNNLVLDEALNYIKDNCTKMVACVGAPTDYTDANTDPGSAGEKLAEVTMVSGDFTVGEGAVSGRKVEVGSKSGVSVGYTGTATHVALLDVTNTAVLYVTTCTSQSLTSGNTITFPVWDIEIADPT